MTRKVTELVMSEKRAKGDGRYIMLDVYDDKLAEHIHQYLIDCSSAAMDNNDFKEAEEFLHDANALAEIIREYNEPLPEDINKVEL